LRQPIATREMKLQRRCVLTEDHRRMSDPRAVRRAGEDRGKADLAHKQGGEIVLLGAEGGVGVHQRGFLGGALRLAGARFAGPLALASARPRRSPRRAFRTCFACALAFAFSIVRFEGFGASSATTSPSSRSKPSASRLAAKWSGTGAEISSAPPSG